ncbi:hypothetical protein [Roseicitreum antarcticum]|uniref:Uncharacterized protein n=1 Tax=Roseicitreum antarcticum TaxID=564137 RepID=A0A1H2U7K3_9RHOB|nr:hypothetical protein [Roseicitreum antarcticum]SDW52126.1 hypothetical protein SAMN04488238_102303 [Roseicitreum antarcticum]
MPLYLVTRPNGASHMKNIAGIHAALVDAASGPAAIAAANALAAAGTANVARMDTPFAGFTATQVAATVQPGFVPAIVQGDFLGAAYSGASRGA